MQNSQILKFSNFFRKFFLSALCLSSIFISGAKAQWTLSGTNIYNNNTANTKVGIGTTTPGAKLEVQIGTALGSSAGSSLLLKRISSTNATNYFMNNLWLSRDAGGSSWLTTRLHDAISIDGSYLTPGTNTRTWWERDPLDDIQAWGNADKTYLKIDQGRLVVNIPNTNEIEATYAKFQIDNTNQNIEGSVSVTGLFYNNHATLYKYAIWGKSRLFTTGEPQLFVGVRGDGSGKCGDVPAIGVYGYAQNSNPHYGVFGTISGEGCLQQSGYAGYFDGKVYIANLVPGSSDIKLKENIKKIDSASAKLMLLSPKTYTFRHNEESFKHLNLPQKQSYGLIAQDLETVFPELVEDITSPPAPDKDGNLVGEKTEFKAIRYIELISIMIAAFQEEHQSNLKKDSLIQSLSERIAKLEKIPQNKTTPSQGSLEVFPNPFKNLATIRYQLPENAESGYLIIRNEKGEIFKEIRLNKGDSREISIETANQSKGLYFCTLIADGEKILSKRMILEK